MVQAVTSEQKTAPLVPKLPHLGASVMKILADFTFGIFLRKKKKKKANDGLTPGHPSK